MDGDAPAAAQSGTRERALSGSDTCSSNRLVQGMMGWGAAHQRLSIYAAGVRTAEERLPAYALRFQCVEVDTSTYAIPSPDAVARWVQRTPAGFQFLFKAYGLFTMGSVPAGQLPRGVRRDRPPTQRVTAAELDASGDLDELWRAFTAALEPARAAGCLGPVLFQFQSSFAPGAASRAIVESCRRRLDARIPMAVEFRSRAWVLGSAAAATCAWLRGAGLALVASDDLAHEMAQADRSQTGLAPGQRREVLPTLLAATAPRVGLYVRVHRRHGGDERRLAPDEIESWAQRIRATVEATGDELSGPVYVLWGTDWRDVPLQNAAALEAALGEGYRSAWGRSGGGGGGAPRAGSIASLFERAAASPRKAEAGGPAGGDGAGVTESAAAAGGKRRAAGGVGPSAKRPAAGRGSANLLRYFLPKDAA